MGRKDIMGSYPHHLSPLSLCVLARKSSLSQNMIVCLGKTLVSLNLSFLKSFQLDCAWTYNVYYVLFPSNARTHWKLLRLQRHLLKPTDLAKYRLRTVPTFRRKKNTGEIKS